MERSRLILLLIACIGIPSYVWLTRDKAEEAAPNTPTFGIALGEHIVSLNLANDLGHEFKENFPRGERGTVLFFWHTRCPAVNAVHPRFEALIARYEKRGILFQAIDSEPLDTKDDIKAHAGEIGAKYTVLRDFKRKTATSLGVDRAATFLAFDHEARLLYRGAFDDSNKPAKVGYVHSVLSALLAGLSEDRVRAVGVPSGGCKYSKIE